MSSTTTVSTASTEIDNDRFLPRYLTVQLLAILAQAAPFTQANVKTTKFVEGYKKAAVGFTALTYSIFWHDNVEKALNNLDQSLDTIDKYNRSPLTLAIANEDFGLANKLIELGATLYLEDKLVLEIALLSMLQRDESIGASILANTPEEAIDWIGEYLDNLHSFAANNFETGKTIDREVLNPPIRHFGQPLNTLDFFNGVPSYYGFLSPSINLLNEHLKNYQDAEFKTIAGAFQYIIDTGKYHANMPTNMYAAERIAAQIELNLEKSSKDPVVIFGGWAGNALALAFVNDTLIYCNIGVGSSLEYSTFIYKIKHKDAISEQFVKQFINGLCYATNPTTILASIGEIVDAQPIYSIPKTLQAVDNCILANPRAIIEGMLLVSSAYKEHGKVNAENLKALSGKIANSYQDYLQSLYKFSISDLTKYIRNGNLLAHNRLECCSLAFEYINQHHNAIESLPRCIELKNAIEFAGLGNYYADNVTPAAQKVLQAYIVRQQELAAIDVIHKEREAIGKKT